jgi:hypothetical protein
LVRKYFWKNDSFLTLKSVCSLVEGAGISALVLLHPGPVLEAVASGLTHHLGLPLLVVDYLSASSTHLTLNFAPSALSVGRALADLLAAEQLAGPVVFYTDYRQLAVFDALVAAGGLKAGGSGAARLVKVETEGLWAMERRPAGEGTAAGVLVLLACRRADGLAFLEAALLAGWLGRGSRVVLPCLDLRPVDIVKYEGVGAVIYLAYLDVPGDRQGGLQGGLTGHLMEDILTGQACFSIRQYCMTSLSTFFRIIDYKLIRLLVLRRP